MILDKPDPKPSYYVSHAYWI